MKLSLAYYKYLPNEKDLVSTKVSRFTFDFQINGFCWHSYRISNETYFKHLFEIET